MIAGYIITYFYIRFLLHVFVVGCRSLLCAVGVLFYVIRGFGRINDASAFVVRTTFITFVLAI